MREIRRSSSVALVGLYDNRARQKAMAEKVYNELVDYLEELVRVSPQGREGAI